MMTLLKMCSFVLQVFKSSAVWVMILVSFFAMFVPEEIRFMINSELIVSMLFLPCMDDNEAIEIVGVERFSIYTGGIHPTHGQLLAFLIIAKATVVAGHCRFSA
ncbi:uncharacterized protein LOC113336679 isoform X1 [Papaver somniferum]|uniref:uncharacterized protein LOC113336679 isoform X1 n=1 Tax=Papaver somniferum TaxID=3469 RepID=UPI000E701D12|nr:uncharacterized protein LOC113336679 isoform X1 [Papaver somniferum]